MKQKPKISIDEIDKKGFIGYPTKLQFNTEVSANFIFQINDLLVDEIGLKSKNNSRIDLMTSIYKLGGKLIFKGIEDEIFESNLILIDSKLPEILSYIVLNSFTNGINNLSTLVDQLKKENPLNFNYRYSQPFYENKIKRLLMSLALGMNSTEIWSSEKEACTFQSIYSNDELIDYLFQNSHLKYFSIIKNNSSFIYEKNGEYFTDLSFKIGVGGVGVN